jgi:fibronectin type 3 domain-containing protein
VTPQDIFPPAAPQGAQVRYVPADGETPAHIELSWSINGEQDLSGYNVYRGDEATAPVRLNPETLLSPAFRDMSAVTGHSYRYTVTAIDQAGNESAPSSAVSANVPQVSIEEK